MVVNIILFRLTAILAHDTHTHKKHYEQHMCSPVVQFYYTPSLLNYLQQEKSAQEETADTTTEFRSHPKKFNRRENCRGELGGLMVNMSLLLAQAPLLLPLPK